MTVSGIDPAVALLVANFPLTAFILWCFYRKLFRLGSDVKSEQEAMEKSHKVEVDLIKEQRDQWKAFYDAEKADRIDITGRITPLAETIKQSAGLIERTVSLSEEILDAKSGSYSLDGDGRNPSHRRLTSGS